MTEHAIKLVGMDECEALYQGTAQVDGQLPVTATTWQQFYRQRPPAHPNPWWIDRGLEATTGLTALAWVPPELACFRGHFPGAPILPGVVQLQWATELAENFSTSRTFAGLARIKFKAPVYPGAVLRFEMQPTATAAHNIRLRVASVAGLHTEGQLLYRG